MKTKKKEKETAFFLKDKPYRRVTSEPCQFQVRDGTTVVIRRRKGKRDKRSFLKQVASSLKVGD